MPVLAGVAKSGTEGLARLKRVVGGGGGSCSPPRIDPGRRYRPTHCGPGSLQSPAVGGGSLTPRLYDGIQIQFDRQSGEKRKIPGKDKRIILLVAPLTWCIIQIILIKIILIMHKNVQPII